MADNEAHGDDMVARYTVLKAGDYGQIISIGDLTTFLTKTTPTLDRITVYKQVAKTDDCIQKSLGRSLNTSTRQRQSTSYLSVFRETDAIDLLSIFVEDAKCYGRDALQALMQAGNNHITSWIIHPHLASLSNTYVLNRDLTQG